MKEIQFSLASTIDKAMQQLYDASRDGNIYYGIFNDKTINSNMSIDEAYIAIVGMNKSDYEKFQEQEFEKMKVRMGNRKKADKWLMPDKEE